VSLYMYGQHGRCVIRIRNCFPSWALCPVCPTLPVFLGCPFLISHSVFSQIFTQANCGTFKTHFNNQMHVINFFFVFISGLWWSIIELDGDHKLRFSLTFIYMLLIVVITTNMVRHQMHVIRYYKRLFPRSFACINPNQRIISDYKI
jgi:hypothetical protein